jgi:adenylate kinase
VRLLVLGPPGAGKGTQGARLADALEIQHIAAGDVLRAEVDWKSSIGVRAGRFLCTGERRLARSLSTSDGSQR